MTCFRFDLGNINSKFDNIKINISKYKNISEQTFITAKSITNSWNDVGSDAFFNVVKNDAIKTQELCDRLEDYQKNLEYFSSELSNIFTSKGYSSNVVVKYDSYHIDRAKEKYRDILSEIKQAEKAFEDCSVPYGFENLDALNEVFNNLYNEIESLGNAIESKLRDTADCVEKLLNNTQMKNNAIEFVSVPDKLLQVNANTVYLTNEYNKLDTDFDKVNINKEVITNELDKEELEKEKEVILSKELSKVENDELVLDKENETMINETPVETSEVDIKLEDKEKANITYKENETEMDKLVLNKEEEAEISGTVFNSEVDLTLSKDEKDIHIDDSSVKTKLDLTGITNNENKKISIEASKNDFQIGSLNLNKDVNKGLGDVSVVSNDSSTNITLDKASNNFNIDNASKEISSNTSVNLESGKTVTAQDIIEQAK